MSAAIILFARAPELGQAKTRLVPPLTRAQATALHAAFVEDMVRRFQSLTHTRTELHTDIYTDAWPDLNVPRKTQITGGLELKLLHGLQAGISAGYSRVAILGTDSPTLPLLHLERLLTSEADVALGPAEDGGFWGISARKTKPTMFEGVIWSRADTLKLAKAAIERSGLSVELAPKWFDVDSPADLDRLLSEPDLPPCTRRWATAFLKSKP